MNVAEPPTERIEREIAAVKRVMDDSDPGAIYSEAYFMDGQNQKLSNYFSYTWKPAQTLPHAIYVSRHLGIQQGHTVLDVGCAKGFFVKAMRMMGFEAFGYDISKWAIENCDPEVSEFVSTELIAPPRSYDWITLKDICEHVEKTELIALVQKLSRAARRGLLIIVPLSAYTGGRYVRDEDEADVTHLHRWTLSDWLIFLIEHTKDFTVSGSYYIKGIKECCVARRMGCGFFTLTRI